MDRRLPVLGAAAALVVGPLALAAPASAASAPAQVRVLHGIPGTPVDVYVDGKRALDDFQPKTVTDDIGLPAGPHKVAIFPATAPDGSGTPLVSATLTVPKTGNVSAVAHLTADGKPTITPYVNDVSSTGAGKGRLTVRHDAAAPAVDVLAGGAPVFRGLTNPEQASAVLPAGTVSAAVALAGTTAPVIGPADVPVGAGQLTVVYAIGSAADKTLDVLVQTLPASGGSPSGVAAGTGGLFDDGAGLPVAVWVAVAGGVLLATGGGLRLARR